MRFVIMAESETSITLAAEGALVASGLGARLLEQECFLHLRHGRELILDVTRLACPDSHGLETLERLKAAGVRLVGKECSSAEPPGNTC